MTALRKGLLGGLAVGGILALGLLVVYVILLLLSVVGLLFFYCMATLMSVSRPDWGNVIFVEFPALWVDLLGMLMLNTGGVLMLGAGVGFVLAVPGSIGVALLVDRMGKNKK